MCKQDTSGINCIMYSKSKKWPCMAWLSFRHSFLIIMLCIFFHRPSSSIYDHQVEAIVADENNNMEVNDEGYHRMLLRKGEIIKKAIATEGGYPISPVEYTTAIEAAFAGRTHTNNAAANVLAIPALGPTVSPGIAQIAGRRVGTTRRGGLISAFGVERAGVPSRLRHKASCISLCKDFRYSPPLSFFTNGVGPTAIEIGDFNGDHIKDLAVAAAGSDVVSVFLGVKGGTFLPGVLYPVGPPGSYPYRLRLADVNQDKKLDIITSNLGAATISILLGRGDGTFTNGFVFATGGAGAIDLALGDFNGDNILDLAVVLAESAAITILWGDGLGGFVRPTQIDLQATHGKPISIVAADLNLDGFMDLVVGLSCTEKNLVSLISMGDGTFLAPIFHDLGCKIHPLALVVGFFNFDLFPDIASANGAHSNSISVLLGRGDGTFRPARTFSVAPGLAPQYLAVGDLNGDFFTDIITANALSNDVTVLQGLGDGAFASIRTFAVDGIGVPGPVALAVGLLNHDVKHDVAVAHFAGNTVSILFNTCTNNLHPLHGDKKHL